MSIRRIRRITWPDVAAKARYLDAGASLDAIDPRLRTLAVRLAGNAPTPRQAVERLFLFVRDRVKYVRDPHGEDFADSASVLSKGEDDCDGKSRLFVALCRALGIERPGWRVEAQIQPVFKRVPGMGEPAFTHVQGRVRWYGSGSFPLADHNGWVLAELTLAGVPLGHGAEAAHRNAMTGRLDVSGVDAGAEPAPPGPPAPEKPLAERVGEAIVLRVVVGLVVAHLADEE